MEESRTLVAALATAFGVGGAGILVATRGSWRQLRDSVLARRYLSWLALAFVYALLALGGVPGATLLAVALAMQAAREAASLLRLKGVYRGTLVALCAAIPLLLVAGAGSWAVGMILLVALGLPIARGRVDELEDSTRMAFGAALIGWTLGHLVVLAQEATGWLILALFGTAVSDVCAFTVGSLVRGPKLVPHLSPRKTWAGLGGNLLGAALALLLVAPLLPPLDYGSAAILVALIGIGACVGDLSESLLKRWAGVKDAGDWLPGFGGLLDRVDSLLVVTPLLAVFASAGRATGAWG